ncbi:MAG: glycoside hydrolase family 3 protein [Ignavibacteriae bacterium]|nr:MAG: glycoside hydrolase family 3 protein [Ignavibacteriota bacterium]
MGKTDYKLSFLFILLLILPFVFGYIADNLFSNKGLTGNSHSHVSYKVRLKLAEMTLREKIAQMIISSTVPAEFKENSSEHKKLINLVTKQKIGGFIFFKGSSSDYARISNMLQSKTEVPLLISSDFERGTGMRVSDGTLFPNNMAIGASGNADLVYKMGQVIAEESRAMGIRQNYAPVCDVNNNPDNPIINVRSFGEDPVLVSKMSAAMIKGLQDGNVIATAKHFPGHGDTEIDSHNDLPVLNFSMDRLNKVELIPFKNAIDNNVKSVMIAHLSFPELEKGPNIPASLSNNIVNGLLLDQMGFKGLVVTDALNMKGITKYFTTKEIALMCVNAGIDLILMPADEEASISAIEEAVNSGQIAEERIDRSVEKILSAKEWLGLYNNKMVDENSLSNIVNTEKSNALAQQIADESITLVKDENKIIPVKDIQSRILVYNISDGKDNVNSGYFNTKINEKFPNAEIVDINQEITSASMSSYIQNASNYYAVIISVYAKVKHGTGKISILSSHTDLINEIASKGIKMIVISLGNPYLLTNFDAVPNYICTYGDANVSINAVIKAIAGDIKITGKLPISIGNNYPVGSGVMK